jgi:hypothetical protein
MYFSSSWESKFNHKFDFFFNAMLLACKCMPLCKKLDCDVHNESPYFVTTLMIKP